MIAAVPAAQTPKYGVTVETEKGIDYAKFKTYAWTPGQPSPMKDVDAAIMAAVDKELAGLGMTKVPNAKADVLVSYASLTRADVNVNSRIRDSNEKQTSYSVGTLAVFLLEPASRKRILRLRADQPIESEPSKRDATIAAATQAMFAQYPTRQKPK
jgi:hypothetical protein